MNKKQLMLTLNAYVLGVMTTVIVLLLSGYSPTILLIIAIMGLSIKPLIEALEGIV